MGILSQLASIGSGTLAGKAVRLPLRLIPTKCVARVISGPMKGLRWRVGASVHGCWLGTYEIEEQRFFERTVKPGMVAWDLGANAGAYTLLLARLVGPTGAVYAFEPFPKNCVALLEHLALNKFDNVTVISAAASEQDGLLGFHVSPSDSMGALQDKWAGLMVPAMSVDGILRDHKLSFPDILKMDVEGAEADVLRGATELLSARRTLWVVSLHGGEQADVCERIFRERGYTLADLEGRRIDRSIRASGITDVVASALRTSDE